MIIREITIENFRSFYGLNNVKLKDGLTLFVGNNGTGKTTIFEALEWLFDTTSGESKANSNMSTSYISKKKISELSEGEIGFVKVAVIFEHDGEKEVEKSFEFKRNANGSISMSNFSFKGLETEGSERKSIHGAKLLDIYFDQAIRKYSLFKGEENLNILENTNALNFLVETYSNVRSFDPYYTGEDEIDSKKGFTDYAVSMAYIAFDKAFKSDKKNTKKERALRSEIDFVRKQLSQTKSQLKTYNDNLITYKTRIQELENSEQAIKLLKGIKSSIEALNEEKINKDKSINENYTINLLDEMWILCGFNPIFEEFQEKASCYDKEKRTLEGEYKKEEGRNEVIKEFEDNFKEGFIPLSLDIPDEKTMKEMLDEERCKFCGRKAEKGSKAYNYMKQRLDKKIKSYQPDENEKKLFNNNYIDEIRHLSIRLEQHKKDINSIKKTIKERIEFNNERINESNELKEEIDKLEENKLQLLAQNSSFNEDEMTNAFTNLSNWHKGVTESEKDIQNKEQEKIKLEEKLQKSENEYNKLARESVASLYKKVYDALKQIRNAFKNAKQINTKDFLRDLEKRSNDYLQKLNKDDFYGIIKIIERANGTAEVIFKDKNNIDITNPNEALKTTMYLSLLFAVSDLTKKKREKDYPLIFDAPTSSFAPKKENDFFNIVSTIEKQCIIFSKSFFKEDGNLDMQKINNLNCTVYRLDKEKGFDEKDLSTIQTKITLLK